MFVEDLAKPALATIDLVASHASVNQAGSADLNPAVGLSRLEVS